MPDRLRAAFSPPRLGGDRSGVYYSNAFLVGILSSRPEGEIFIEIFDSNLMKISPIVKITALNFISIKEASVVTYICFAAS